MPGSGKTQRLVAQLNEFVIGHGGRIYLESSVIGEGTTFVVQFPV